MRFHDGVALSGLGVLLVGLVIAAFWPGRRLIGGGVALVGLAVLAWGASFL